MQYKYMQNIMKSTIQYKPSCRRCWRFCANLLCRRFTIHFISRISRSSFIYLF